MRRPWLYLALALIILSGFVWHLLSPPPITVVGNLSRKDVAQIKRAVHRNVITVLPPRHLKWLPNGIQHIFPDLFHPITWIALMPDGSVRVWYRVEAIEGAKVGIWYTGGEHRWGTAECRLSRGPEGWQIGSAPMVVPGPVQVR